MSDIVTRRYAITKKGVDYVVELRIDVDALAQDMVNSAAGNKTGKATEVSRTIVAKVVDKKPAAGGGS